MAKKVQAYVKLQVAAADMTGADIEAMTRSIEGTARSMGLVVED